MRNEHILPQSSEGSSCCNKTNTGPLQAQGEANFLHHLENTTKRTLESCWKLSTKESFHTCQALRPLKGLIGTYYSIPAQQGNWAIDYLSYWPGKGSNTSSQDTETVLEIHQPSSKGERSIARFTSLPQQGREAEAAARAQPSCIE